MDTAEAAGTTEESMEKEEIVAEATPVGTPVAGGLLTGAETGAEGSWGSLGFWIVKVGEALPESLTEPTTAGHMTIRWVHLERKRTARTDDDVVVRGEDLGDGEGHLASIDGEVSGKRVLCGAASATTDGGITGWNILMSRNSVRVPGSWCPRRRRAVVFWPSAPILAASHFTVCCEPEVHTSPAWGAVIGGSYTVNTFGCRFGGAAAAPVGEGTSVGSALVGTADAESAESAKTERRALTRGVNIVKITCGYGCSERTDGGGGIE